MMATINFWAKRVIAYPLVMTGYLMTSVAKWLILAGAWIADVETE